MAICGVLLYTYSIMSLNQKPVAMSSQTVNKNRRPIKSIIIGVVGAAVLLFIIIFVSQVSRSTTPSEADLNNRLNTAIAALPNVKSSDIGFSNLPNGGGAVQGLITANSDDPNVVRTVFDQVLRAIYFELKDTVGTRAVSVNVEALSEDGSVRLKDTDLGFPQSPTNNELGKRYDP